jgi:hypothetical protein
MTGDQNPNAPDVVSAVRDLGYDVIMTLREDAA